MKNQRDFGSAIWVDTELLAAKAAITLKTSHRSSTEPIPVLVVFNAKAVGNMLQ